ncbi:Aste57867_16636 [Aphanomyces stellatus]|uniref:Purple acid phosphatase n=1 Tax=Aphanomyces stellatus TaxID=120398 RepID=A0A485L5X1_9STRA|nr:hypothetical protein As57867_016579 [Aphanomyces stellatus]VFT93407.1 Aste57867_16636 [Aphanomyces stellatus]
MSRFVLFVVAATAASLVSQVHLSLTNAAQGCPNGVAVSFASPDAAPFVVEYGIQGENSIRRSASSSDSYSVSSGSYSYTSPFLHTAYLCDLQPLSIYDYSIRGGGKSFSFRTTGSVGCPHTTTIIGVVGDPGDTSDSGKAVSNLALTLHGQPTHALVIAGDYSYANGEHAVWDQWYDFHEAVFARIPQLGINGNHETITYYGHNGGPRMFDYVGEDYLGYLKRTVSPITEAAKAAKRTYYSFEIGLVHMVFLDDYVGSKGSKINPVGTNAWLQARNLQLQWLAQDLARVNRSVTPYVVVVKHNPFYNTWNDHQCQCSTTRHAIHAEDRDNCWRGVYAVGAAMYEPHCGLQAKFELLFVQHRVDIVMAGHVHAYERTARIAHNQVDEVNGVVYITTGAGGNYEGHAGPRLASPLPEWSLRANNQVYGSAKVVATQDNLQVHWFTEFNGVEPWDSVTLLRRANIV